MAISLDIVRNARNDPKFYLRWNEGLPRTGLHTGTRYSTRSGRNGTESLTLIITTICIMRFSNCLYSNKLIVKVFHKK
jgi:hypothetical protein